MFGSIFLLAQFLQTAQHLSPLAAGLRILPWTAMPLLVAPIAGPLSDRIGGRPLMVTGLALQAGGLAWLAAVLSPGVTFGTLVIPFVLCGVGMSLFFVPVSNMVLGSVPASEEGVASGANNAVRELGGVIGIAILASVFASRGSYASPAAFVAGTRPAILIGAIIVAGGAVAAALTRGRSRTVRRGRSRRRRRADRGLTPDGHSTGRNSGGRRPMAITCRAESEAASGGRPCPPKRLPRVGRP